MKKESSARDDAGQGSGGADYWERMFIASRSGELSSYEQEQLEIAINKDKALSSRCREIQTVWNLLVGGFQYLGMKAGLSGRFRKRFYSVMGIKYEGRGTENNSSQVKRKIIPMPPHARLWISAIAAAFVVGFTGLMLTTWIQKESSAVDDMATLDESVMMTTRRISAPEPNDKFNNNKALFFLQDSKEFSGENISVQNSLEKSTPSSGQDAWYKAQTDSGVIMSGITEDFSDQPISHHGGDEMDTSRTQGAQGQVEGQSRSYGAAGTNVRFHSPTIKGDSMAFGEQTSSLNATGAIVIDSRNAPDTNTEFYSSGAAYGGGEESGAGAESEESESSPSVDNQSNFAFNGIAGQSITTYSVQNDFSDQSEKVAKLSDLDTASRATESFGRTSELNSELGWSMGVATESKDNLKGVKRRAASRESQSEWGLGEDFEEESESSAIPFDSNSDGIVVNESLFDDMNRALYAEDLAQALPEMEKSRRSIIVEERKKFDRPSIKGKAKGKAENLSTKLGLAIPAPAPAPAQLPAASELEPFPESETSENPLSTFSLNVSDASFRLALAAFTNGDIPDPGQVRSEEFINAFDYRDPVPSGNTKVAIQYERALWPFEMEREVLRIGVRANELGLNLESGMNLVILLDTSGSMEREDRSRTAERILEVVAEHLSGNDTISLIGFSSDAKLWVDGMPGGSPEDFLRVAEGIRPSGGTNIEAALNLGYQKLFQRFKHGGNNRILLLTDGAANLGELESGQLSGIISANRLKGAALDCFGIGWDGYDDSLVESLTRNSDGKYGFLNSPDDADSYFKDNWFKAIEVSARNVKVQVEFNPQRVSRYRQMGYQKHRLTAEQFRDNSVDAGEMGKAESGNALYIIRSMASGTGPLGWIRVRYQDPATGNFSEVEKIIEYRGPAPSMELAQPSIRLAASAGAFAEWLGNNPYAAQVDLTQLDRWMDEVSGIYAPDPRPASLQNMIRLARVSGIHRP